MPLTRPTQLNAHQFAMLLDTLQEGSVQTASRSALASSEKIEIVKDPARFRQLKPQWDALWDRSVTGGAYQSFDNCLHMWEALAQPGGRKLFCLVGWQGYQARAIWPLTTFRQYAWRSIRPLEASGAEYTDLLLDPSLDAQRWLTLAWQTIKRQAHCDVMVLPYVKADTPLHAVTTAMATNAIVDPERGVYATLQDEADWDSYYNSLSNTLRRKYRNIRRKLEKIGNIRLETVAAGDPRCPELVDWMLAQKRVWTERSQKSGPWVYSAEYRDFLVRLLSNPEATPKSFLFTMHADDTLLGVKLGTAGKSLSEALVAAFNADYEKQSPGVILDEYYVRWAFDQRLNCDFGNGAERNKLFWTRHATVDTATFTVPMSLWGKAYLKARTWSRNRNEKKTAAAGSPSTNESSEETDTTVAG